MKNIILALTFITAVAFALSNASVAKQGKDLMDTKPTGYPVATFGGGCFWCTEYEFRALDGVVYTRVGYMGSAVATPTYEDVKTGASGHVEVIEITFDPALTSYEALVEHFLTKGHDPTQLNRQGPDVGTQYRSVIFTHSDDQADIARELIAKVEASGQYSKPIVTAVEDAQKLWEAEEYHQRYYEKYEQTYGRKHPNAYIKDLKRK